MKSYRVVLVLVEQERNRIRKILKRMVSRLEKEIQLDVTLIITMERSHSPKMVLQNHRVPFLIFNQGQIFDTAFTIPNNKLKFTFYPAVCVKVSS
jgi:hypothetical protein